MAKSGGLTAKDGRGQSVSQRAETLKSELGPTGVKQAESLLSHPSGVLKLAYCMLVLREKAAVTLGSRAEAAIAAAPASIREAMRTAMLKAKSENPKKSRKQSAAA